MANSVLPKKLSNSINDYTSEDLTNHVENYDVIGEANKGNTLVSANIYSVGYSKRGTAKCAGCK